MKEKDTSDRNLENEPQEKRDFLRFDRDKTRLHPVLKQKTIKQFVPYLDKRIGFILMQDYDRERKRRLYEIAFVICTYRHTHT